MAMKRGDVGNGWFKWYRVRSGLPTWKMWKGMEAIMGIFIMYQRSLNISDYQRCVLFLILRENFREI